MKLIAILATFVALSATAEEEKPLEAPVRCVEGLCIVPQKFVEAMIEAHNELVQENRDLEKKVKTPKCADSTVTEPSKSFKPTPPVKVERNS